MRSLKHAVDDIIGGTDDVVVFVARFNLGQHDLVDVEELIDDVDFFARLLLIPDFEFIEQILVDVVSPVVDLKRVLAVTALGRK